MRKLIPLIFFVACWMNAKAAPLNVDLSHIDTQSAAWSKFAATTPANAYDAVILSRVTGDPKYCTAAVTIAEKQVSDAEALMTRSPVAKPAVSGDSYLQAGPMIADIAMPYAYCPITDEQKARWSAYANQTIYNIWNYAQATWNGAPFPWSGWGTNLQGNNYHYSFLLATSMWGFAGNDEWIEFLRTSKVPQVIAYFTAGGTGGGSREGTWYGVRHNRLFDFYKLWQDNTGENLADRTSHAKDSIDYWIHATLPTLNKFAPIGDQSRSAFPTLSELHKGVMLSARRIAPAAEQAKATWWLKRAVTLTLNGAPSLLPIGTTETAPPSLYHYSPGAGHLFARDNWTADAMWLSFVAGRFDESHAAQDQGGFTLFHKDFLAVTENIYSRTGIQQTTDTQNVIRFENSNGIIIQRRRRETAMTVTPGQNGAITAEANLSPFYASTDGIQWSRKLTSGNKTVEIADTISVPAGTSAIWQLNTPVQPVKVSDNQYRAGDLLVTVLAPANPAISIQDWKVLDPAEHVVMTTINGQQVDIGKNAWRLNITGATNEYRVRLDVMGQVAPPVEPPPVVVPPPVIPPVVVPPVSITPPIFENDNVKINIAPRVPFSMAADMADLNSDGWLDFFIGSHQDTLPSAMFLQESGLVKYYDNASNYTQPLPLITNGGQRNTSNHFFFNFTGDSLGRLSYIGQDADRGKSALYPIESIVDGKPIYAPKKLGCPVETCVMLDSNNDGVLEYYDRGFLRTATGVVIQTLKIGDKWPTGPQSVFDVNGDTYPDILYVLDRGYFQYNPAASLYEWQSDKVQANTLDPLTGSGHSTPLDYDNDGDQDYYTGQGHYSPVGADSVATIHGPNVFYPHLFRNDNGNFVEVTVEAGLGAANLLKNTYYWTTYCSTKAADVNADGNMDLIMCGEAGRDSSTANTITMILNNGNGTFTVSRLAKLGMFKYDDRAGDRPAFSVGDYNNDCRIDLVKTHTKTSDTIASIGLFRNTTNNGNHCLRVYAQGKTTGGLHSRIVVRKAGTQAILGSQQIGIFTTGTRNLYPFFGLGKETLVDVDVYFQGGQKVTVTNQPADRTLIVRESGEVVTNYVPGINPLLAVADGTVPPVEPPDEEPPVEEPPIEEPELSYDELLLIIEELRGDVLRLVGEKQVLATANTAQASEIAAINVNLTMAQESLSRAEAAASQLRTELTEEQRVNAILRQPITVRRTETGIEVGE